MDNQRNIFASTAATMLQALPLIKHKQLAKVGINAELSSELDALTCKELAAVSKSAEKFLTIQFDANQLKGAIQGVVGKRKDQDFQDAFLMNQATSQMMREFFGMHPSEFCARRRELGLDGLGIHRPPFCDEKTEVVIWRAWMRHEGDDERMRYLRVAEETMQPLSVIWTTIEQHKDVTVREM